MSTPNQLSDTPRTDAAWAKTFIDDDDQCRAGNAATDMRDACATLERELAAERARLDWVFHNCKVTADDFTTGNRDVYAIHDRDDLGAAMKEDAK
jgi:hypothetical protein